MTSKQQVAASSVALVAALGVGFGAAKLSAQAPVPTLQLIGVRVLGPTSDTVHPYYYGVSFMVQPYEAGTKPVQREVTCMTDGNGPLLDGAPYAAAADICATVVATATDLAAKTSAIASTVLAPNVAPLVTMDAAVAVDLAPAYVPVQPVGP